ncbi:MAG TPA: metallophosphoesterase [Woeseiaceae bacterium]|nr:metallophosphoesterase [Woeseiaceae bacterium]
MICKTTRTTTTPPGTGGGTARTAFPGLAALAVLAALVQGCAAGTPSPAQGAATPSSPGSAGAAERGTDATSILLIGDTGYDYDWLEAEDYEQPLTARDFVIAELDDWLEDKMPVDEFRLPSMHYLEKTGGYVMASGMWPVSQAAIEWCAAPSRCTFGVMVGDNIYPSGATLGTDGRDDEERFADLLWEPYKGFLEQDPDFRLYAVLGNHDWETSREGAMLQVEYMEASPLYHMDGIYYRARPAPDVELFAIDTTVMLAGHTVYKDLLDDAGVPQRSDELEPEVPWAMPEGDEAGMLGWLERSLRESDARWKIVIAHHPLWSSSGTKVEEEIVLRRILRPMLCRYADAYIAGHDHMLEVHTDDCRDQAQGDAPPLLHIVSGAAGKQRPEHSSFMAWQEREHPGFRSLYVRSLVWGFGELVLEGDGAHVLMLTTPRDGSGGTAVEFDARFERRSGVLRGQAD